MSATAGPGPGGATPGDRRTEHAGPDDGGGWLRSRFALPAATGLIAAVLAASCCILPILLIALGVAGAGLMATAMAYEWITLPAGTLGLVIAYALYFREKRRCETQACRFVGRGVNRALLAATTLIVVAALLLRLFPSWTASLVQAL